MPKGYGKIELRNKLYNMKPTIIKKIFLKLRNTENCYFTTHYKIKYILKQT